MRRTAALLLTLAVGTAALAAEQGKVDRAAVEKQIVASERAINEAFAKGDLKAFNAHLDPQGYGIDPSGVTKVADMGAMLTQAKITSWNIDNTKVIWVDDNTAVHMYRWTGKGTFQGNPIPSPTYASTVWANRGGKWVAVFHQETTAMEMPPPKK